MSGIFFILYCLTFPLEVLHTIFSLGGTTQRRHTWEKAHTNSSLSFLSVLPAIIHLFTYTLGYLELNNLGVLRKNFNISNQLICGSTGLVLNS